MQNLSMGLWVPTHIAPDIRHFDQARLPPERQAWPIKSILTPGSDER